MAVTNLTALNPLSCIPCNFSEHFTFVFLIFYSLLQINFPTEIHPVLFLSHCRIEVFFPFLLIEAFSELFQFFHSHFFCLYLFQLFFCFSKDLLPIFAFL